ncbi:MAG: hypothetical protein JO256_02310 [Alphaproteobacteria bacterium]|nr:hypothetical protein [Alphaproteobacteria bacterium]
MGQSQAQAAIALGISQPTYAQWELNQKAPSSHQWPAILGYLGYDPICAAPSSFAEKIGWLQRRRGLSLGDLAAMLGVHRQTVAGILRPNAKTRLKLRASIDALFLRES